MEEYFTNSIFNKEIISKIHKELEKLVINKLNNHIQKWSTDVNREFPKVEMKMVNKHFKNVHQRPNRIQGPPSSPNPRDDTILDLKTC